MKMNDKQLREIYNLYINKPIYRVQSDEYTRDMKKNGLNPKKDPFLRMRKRLEGLFKIVLRLEKQGIIFTLDWGRPVSGSYAVKVTREDLKSPFIDFTIVKKDVMKMGKAWKGGANVTNTKELCNLIIGSGAAISNKEKKTVNYFIRWVKNKSRYKNRIIVVNGSSRVFESAHFQHHLGKAESERYWASPYGRFENFKKVLGKYGLKRYLPFLKQEKVGHLRVREEIPASEINILK